MVKYCYVCGERRFGVGGYVVTRKDKKQFFCCSKDCWNRLTEEDKKEDSKFSLYDEPYRDICFSCDYFKNINPNSDEKGIWYNHKCNKVLELTKKHESPFFQPSYCKRAISSPLCEQLKMFNRVNDEITRFELMDI